MGLKAETRPEFDRRRWAELDRLEAARRAELGVGVLPEVVPATVPEIRTADLANYTIPAPAWAWCGLVNCKCPAEHAPSAELTTYAHRGGFELAWGGVR